MNRHDVSTGLARLPALGRHTAVAAAFVLAMAACTRSPSDTSADPTPRSEPSAPTDRKVAPRPAGPPADTQARIKAITAALVAKGWKEGNFTVTRDGPDIGQWQTFMAFTTNPSGTLVDVWAGPHADRDAADIVIAGQPLARAQLRILVEQASKLRDVAHIVVRTAGHGSELGDPETGSSKGAPGPLEGKLRAPGVDDTPRGKAFVFDARTLKGGYVRVVALLSGDGPVTLDIQPL